MLNDYYLPTAAGKPLGNVTAARKIDGNMLRANG